MKYILVIAIVGVLAAAGITPARNEKKSEGAAANATSAARSSLNELKTLAIIGGVVPHHDLVASEIERFWKTLAETQASPDVILLIGPDHRDIAASELVTTSVADPFETPANLSRGRIISARDKGVLREDPNAFRGEHSIGLHLSYLSRFFPNASVFPILARSDASQKQVIALVNELRQTNTGAIAVVASVDFSHEHTREEAQSYDEESLKTLTTFDERALARYGPEHMDSDQSILFVSEFVCPTHNCKWETLYHGNSSDLPYQSQKITTSYFSLFLFPKKNARTNE